MIRWQHDDTSIKVQVKVGCMCKLSMCTQIARVQTITVNTLIGAEGMKWILITRSHCLYFIDLTATKHFGNNVWRSMWLIIQIITVNDLLDPFRWMTMCLSQQQPCLWVSPRPTRCRSSRMKARRRVRRSWAGRRVRGPQRSQPVVCPVSNHCWLSWSSSTSTCSTTWTGSPWQVQYSACNLTAANHSHGLKNVYSRRAKAGNVGREEGCTWREIG